MRGEVAGSAAGASARGDFGRVPAVAPPRASAHFKKQQRAAGGQRHFSPISSLFLGNVRARGSRSGHRIRRRAGRHARLVPRPVGGGGFGAPGARSAPTTPPGDAPAPPRGVFPVRHRPWRYTLRRVWRSSPRWVFSGGARPRHPPVGLMVYVLGVSELAEAALPRVVTPSRLRRRVAGRPLRGRRSPRRPAYLLVNGSPLSPACASPCSSAGCASFPGVTSRRAMRRRARRSARRPWRGPRPRSAGTAGILPRRHLRRALPRLLFPDALLVQAHRGSNPRRRR